MILHCLGPAVPQVLLVRLSEPPHSPARWEVLQSNDQLASLVDSLAWPRVSVSSLTSRQGHDLQVKLYLPAGLRPGDRAKVPLLLHT